MAARVALSHTVSAIVLVLACLVTVGLSIVGRASGACATTVQTTSYALIAVHRSILSVPERFCPLICAGSRQVSTHSCHIAVGVLALSADHAGSGACHGARSVPERAECSRDLIGVGARSHNRRIRDRGDRRQAGAVGEVRSREPDCSASILTALGDWKLGCHPWAGASTLLIGGLSAP